MYDPVAHADRDYMNNHGLDNEFDDQGRYVGVTRRDYKPADPKDLVGPDYNPFLEDEK